MSTDERRDQIETQKRKLYSAIATAYDDARQQASQYRAQIGGDPFWKGDQARHDAYFQREAEQAEQAARWLHTRLMQFKPD